MRYNTGYSKNGKYSKTISAGQRHNYGRAVHRNDISYAQFRYARYLIALCRDNGIDERTAIGGYSLSDKICISKAIEHIKKTLNQNGIKYDVPVETAKDKAHKERINGILDEIENTNWIPMSERKPDRKYVKTLDRTGFMRTYEWNGETFIDALGNPLTKEWERTQYRCKVPYKWAYLGKEGMK